MSDRCPTNVKYEFHGMDIDINKDFTPATKDVVEVVRCKDCKW